MAWGVVVLNLLTLVRMRAEGYCSRSVCVCVCVCVCPGMTGFSP